MPKPIIILSSGAADCGCLIARALLDSQSHLIVGQTPKLPDPMVIESFKDQFQPSLENFIHLKQSAHERANPNQPWYAKFQKKRRRR